VSTTDGNIQAARTRLGKAIQELTAPRTRLHGRDTITAPSLYGQLCANLAGNQGDTRTPAKSLPPLWIDAAQLIFDIDSQTHRWIPTPGKTPQRLHMLNLKTWRPQDTDHVTTIARTVEEWSSKILNLLDPEVQIFLPYPCPRCARRFVYRKDSAGEEVRRPALKLVANVGCTCQACNAHWPPDKYLFLQKLLGLAPTEGVVQ